MPGGAFANSNRPQVLPSFLDILLTPPTVTRSPVKATDDATKEADNSRTSYYPRWVTGEGGR